jgi:NADH-quinone oxidoreductase subunit N
MVDNIITSIFGDLTPLAAMIFLLVGALIMPGLQMFVKKHTVTWVVALVFVILAFITDAILLTSEVEMSYLGVKLNTYTTLMSMLFLIVVFLVVLVSNVSTEVTKSHAGAYYSLLFGATLGMLFVASSSSLLTIFVGVELTSISSYALVALKRKDGRASEAAVKYAIIGGMSTALTLYGISMIYGLTGTLAINELALYVAANEFTWMFGIGIICMIAGYGFKIAAVPFHMWAPDVYEGAATPVSMFLATGSKKMGLAVFIQVFLAMFILSAAVGDIFGLTVQYIFAVIAAITMTVGNVVAIAQSNIKRMLAYSSIAQAGYILIILAVMTPQAEAAGIFHMFTHVFMKGGAFLIVGGLICAGIGEKISDYRGLAKRAPFLAAAMMLFLFSLAGIPPLAGFTSKFFLFASAVGTPGEADGTWIWLAFVAILNSAISLYYYARVVKAMYIEKGESTEKIAIPRIFTIAIVICLVFVVVLGVYPDLLYGFCEDATAFLF